MFAVGLPLILVAALLHYVRSNPIIFNESFFGHAHCIKQAGSSLLMRAHDNGGQFPFHTNGYGDALLMMTNYSVVLDPFTGPGFDTSAFEHAMATSGNVPEEGCGRVYVQGLRNTNSPEIAVLFDKLSSPGDHCGGFRRLRALFGREVGYLDGSVEFIRDSEWPMFVAKQIKLLEAAGIPKGQAEQLYSSAAK